MLKTFFDNFMRTYFKRAALSSQQCIIRFFSKRSVKYSRPVSNKIFRAFFSRRIFAVLYFWSNKINKDISVNFYQKCFRCSAIWAYNICYHGNILGSRPPRYKRLFWPLKAFYTVYCIWCIICMIQQAFKYVTLSSWPCLMSSKLRTTKILKSGWRDWKRVGCHGNGISTTSHLHFGE